MPRSANIPFLLAALALVGAAPAGTQGQTPPNVLFLVTDDQRPDAVGALDNPAIQTPNLDDLVRRGFAFRHAYCMGSTMGAVCNPSRHMLLSGQSLYRYRPQERKHTWGDAFGQAGYETFHLSKRGNSAVEYHKAFEHSEYLDDDKERKSGHHGRAAADRAIEFLLKQWRGERPFCMYLGFEGPHDPRVAAKEWTDLYRRDRLPLPANYLPYHPFDNGWLTGRDERLAPWPRGEEDVRQHLHDYYACISSLDSQIGRILQTLRDLRQLDNTLVIFTSDHGLAIGSHGLFGKQNLYEHSMRAPLVIAGPGISAGSSPALTYLFDIFPTACDLAGIPIPDGIDGRSFADVIQGRTFVHRDCIFLAFEKGQRAVRQGAWKLHRFPLVNHSLLFNLRDDPDETRNLAQEPAQAETVERLLALLEQQQQTWGDAQSLSSDPAQPLAVDLEFFRRAIKSNAAGR